MRRDFLSRSPWNLIILAITFLLIVLLGWWTFQANPWLNPTPRAEVEGSK